MAMDIQGVGGSGSQTNAGYAPYNASNAAGRDTSNAAGSSGSKQSSAQEQREVEKLKQRDQDVRAHEEAHMAAGGRYVRGGPTFQYETGPDGKQYAVGGEVSIDTSPVKGDPRATIQKMQTVIAAALAPADPSGQDEQVAAQAEQAMAQAQADLAQQRRSGQSGSQAPSIGGTNQGSQKKSIGYTSSGSFAQAAGSAGLVNALA